MGRLKQLEKAFLVSAGFGFKMVCHNQKVMKDKEVRAYLKVAKRLMILQIMKRKKYRICNWKDFGRMMER